MKAKTGQPGQDKENNRESTARTEMRGQDDQREHDSTDRTGQMGHVPKLTTVAEQP
jgi:hypothetical protein